DEPNDAPATGGSTVGAQIGSPDGIPGLERLMDDTRRNPLVPKLPEHVKTTTAASPKDPTPTPPKRISRVQMATPIHRVDPIYPHLAKTTGISGTVELVGVLGTDGRIRELRVLRGHPLLINAALDAVKQWVYAPTLLNGEPVEVQAPITVNFILNR